jgi:NAD(P)-dependent dehydrogenase (short-subunit alcohol dehydrogenase family)
MMQKRIVVITGANRGLGLGTAVELAKKGFKVLMLGRRLAEVDQHAQSIRSNGGDAEAYQVDVTNPSEVERFAKQVTEKYGIIHSLINNAGAFLDRDRNTQAGEPSIMATDPGLVAETFEINTIGPMRMCQAMMPMLKRADHATIVNISSGMGQLSAMDGYYPAYRMSKTALNAMTRVFASELVNTKIKVNSVCPGWVKTDMGGPNATRSLAEGVSGIVWAASLDVHGPTGGFFRDAKPLPW